MTKQYAHQCSDCELVVNHPHFDEEFENEDDIFIFAGYVEPGKHQIYIHDPETGRIYRKKNVVVYPRSKALKQKSAQSALEYEKEYVKTTSNFKAAKSVIYGDILVDLQPKMIEFTFKKDIEAIQSLSVNLIRTSISK